MAPLYESVPPTRYGGTERVVSYLTEELVRLGHDVTLFASGDSVTSATLVAGSPCALWADPSCRETLPQHVHMVERVFNHPGGFDVIHFHLDYLHFPLVRRARVPTVTTLHGMLNPSDVGPLFSTFGDVPLVSISDAQRAPVPNAHWLGTVHHGLPRDLHTYRETPGEYLAFLGRISPEKRVDRAIEIARISGRPLKIAARIYPEERAYFTEKIEPLIRGSSAFVEFVGEIGGADKDAFLGNARALLFPINWEEPFGLVMVESMACGTPVIAWRRGSVPEVIDEGVTGFVVDDIDEAAAAVDRLSGLHRRACRRMFERRFDAARMATDYLDVYQRAIRGL